MTKRYWENQKFIFTLWFKSKQSVIETYLEEMGLGGWENLSDRNKGIINNKSKRELIREINNKINS